MGQDKGGGPGYESDRKRERRQRNQMMNWQFHAGLLIMLIPFGIRPVLARIVEAYVRFASIRAAQKTSRIRFPPRWLSSAPISAVASANREPSSLGPGPHFKRLSLRALDGDRGRFFHKPRGRKY